MKKLQVMLFLIVATILSVGAKTVWYNNTDGWSRPAVYYWGGANGLNDWNSAIPLTLDSKSGLYSATIPNDISGMKFRDLDGNSQSSGNITNIPDNGLWTGSGTSYKAYTPGGNVTYSVSIKNGINNSWKWENVSLTKDADGNWVSDKITLEKFNFKLLKKPGDNTTYFTTSGASLNTWLSVEPSSSNQDAGTFFEVNYNEYIITYDPSADKVKISLYSKPEVVKDYYLIGSMNGWKTNDADYKMTTTDNGETYTFSMPKVDSGMEFKIFCDASYITPPTFSGNLANELYVSSNVIFKNGEYTDVTFTFNASTYNLEVNGTKIAETPVVEDYYLIGDMNPDKKWTQCDPDYKMTTTDNGETYTLTLPKVDGGIQFKVFTKPNGQATYITPSKITGDLAKYLNTDNNDKNVTFAAGEYTDVTFTYTVDSKNLEVNGTKKAVDPVITNISYKLLLKRNNGSPEAWSEEIFEMAKGEDGNWSCKVELERFNFTLQEFHDGEYDSERTLSHGDSNDNNADGFALKAGNGEYFVFTTSGTYTVIYNPTEEKVYFKLIPVARDIYLTGTWNKWATTENNDAWKFTAEPNGDAFIYKLVKENLKGNNSFQLFCATYNDNYFVANNTTGNLSSKLTKVDNGYGAMKYQLAGTTYASVTFIFDPETSTLDISTTEARPDYSEDLSGAFDFGDKLYVWYLNDDDPRGRWTCSELIFDGVSEQNIHGTNTLSCEFVAKTEKMNFMLATRNVLGADGLPQGIIFRNGSSFEVDGQHLGHTEAQVALALDEVAKGMRSFKDHKDLKCEAANYVVTGLTLDETYRFVVKPHFSTSKADAKPTESCVGVFSKDELNRPWGNGKLYVYGPVTTDTWPAIDDYNVPGEGRLELVYNNAKGIYESAPFKLGPSHDWEERGDRWEFCLADEWGLMWYKNDYCYKVGEWNHDGLFLNTEDNNQNFYFKDGFNRETEYVFQVREWVEEGVTEWQVRITPNVKSDGLYLKYADGEIVEFQPYETEGVYIKTFQLNPEYGFAVSTNHDFLGNFVNATEAFASKLMGLDQKFDYLIGDDEVRYQTSLTVPTIVTCAVNTNDGTVAIYAPSFSLSLTNVDIVKVDNQDLEEDFNVVIDFDHSNDNLNIPVHEFNKLFGTLKVSKVLVSDNPKMTMTTLTINNKPVTGELGAENYVEYLPVAQDAEFGEEDEYIEKEVGVFRFNLNGVMDVHFDQPIAGSDATHLNLTAKSSATANLSTKLRKPAAPDDENPIKVAYGYMEEDDNYVVAISYPVNYPNGAAIEHGDLVVFTGYEVELKDDAPQDDFGFPISEAFGGFTDEIFEGAEDLILHTYHEDVEDPYLEDGEDDWATAAFNEHYLPVLMNVTSPENDLEGTFKIIANYPIMQMDGGKTTPVAPSSSSRRIIRKADAAEETHTGVVNLVNPRETAIEEAATHVHDVITGIESVRVNANNAIDAPAEYYNLQGIRVAKPAPGQIYIIRQGNSTTKQLLK